MSFKEKVIFNTFILNNNMTFFIVVQLLSHIHLFATSMDYSLPGSSVHGIFQARILEWVAISFARGFSQPRNQTRVSWIDSGLFTTESTGKPRCDYTY